MKTRLIIIIIFATILLLASVGTGLYLYFSNRPQANEPSDSSSGEPPTEDSSSDETEDYYGTSTFGECSCGCSCITDGCNGEICRSSDEEPVATPCMLPDKPLPRDLGYSCRCFQSQCQWTK